MELRVLNYFLVIAREENFTKAAEQLHITQPTLSRQISGLEEELGVKLFKRGSHSVELTEDGMILRRRAQELLAVADKTKRDFLCKGENLEGVVSVGSGEFLSTGVLAECISAFRKIHPLVKYEIYSGNAANITDNIERGMLDIGLMGEPVDIRKFDFVSMPVKEEMGALVTENSDLARRGFITPEDFIGVPVIAPANNLVLGNIKKWLGENAEKIDIAVSSNLLYNAAQFVSATGGIALGMRLNCRYSGLCFVPFSPKLCSGTALVWKKEQVFSAATSEFIAFAKEYLKGIAKNDS